MEEVKRSTYVNVGNTWMFSLCMFHSTIDTENMLISKLFVTC